MSSFSRLAAVSALFVLTLSPVLALAQPRPETPSEPRPGEENQGATHASPSAPAASVEAPVVTPPVGQPMPQAQDASRAKTAAKPWYERLSIRGYVQLRYNRLGNDIHSLTGSDALDNDKFLNPSQDKYLGPKSGFSLRRARFILSGDVHERAFFYFQLDAASAVADDKQHFVQIRDLYADLALDSAKEFRFRVGQSKVPFGWDNMQSSQNRLAIDRSDALNSGAPGERDLGVFFYWAPASKRALFKHLVDSGLKGSGDFGVVAIGAYNGEGVNIKESNDNRHVIARLAWPQRLWGEQIIEGAVGGYTGKYRAYPKDPKAAGAAAEADVLDWRGHATFVWYPAPVGVQTEITWGRGPERVTDNAGNSRFDDRWLFGGYVTVMGRVKFVYPYMRYQWYEGNRKEADAPHMKTKEVEGGLEWHIGKPVELVTAFAWAKRAVGDRRASEVEGRALRLQLQWNYN